MPDFEVLMSGIAFGESPRWGRDERLWFADWGAQEIVAVDLDGNSEVILTVGFASFPMCFDWLPDGRLLLVSARDGRLLRREHDGSVVTHADLSGLAGKGHPWNEIVVDGRGNAYVNNQGFDFPGGEFGPGTIALLEPNGAARIVAEGIAFPNGMAVTADNATLIVAESYAKKLTAFDIDADGGLSGRRVWADLGDGFRTASASMLKERSGTRMCPTSAASWPVPVVKSSRESTTIAAAFRVRSEAPMEPRSSSSRRSGVARTRWLTGRELARCSSRLRPPRMPAGRSRR
jgi:sugar lactone lactonase YvrE